MGIIIGGITFPLVAQAAGAAVAPVADPFANVALPYWQKCIDVYIKPALIVALGLQVQGTTNQACRATLQVDPLPWLDSVIQDAPVLACFPARARESRLTMERDQVTFTYRLLYILPATDWETYKKVAPIVSAAYVLITGVTERQFDANYASGQHVWTTAGLTKIEFGEAEFGLLEPPSSIGAPLPFFATEVFIYLRTEADETDSEDLDDQDVDVDEGTAEDGLLPDAVSGKTSVG